MLEICVKSLQSSDEIVIVPRLQNILTDQTQHNYYTAVQDNSPARILVLALGNGFAYASLMYFVYSMMKLKYRRESERYSELEFREDVFVRANNLNGFLAATTESKDGKDGVKFKILRTSLEKTRNREDARVRLCKGDIARLCNTDEDVTIMSDPPCQVSSDALYDVMYYDGTWCSSAKRENLNHFHIFTFSFSTTSKEYRSHRLPMPQRNLSKSNVRMQTQL